MFIGKLTMNNSLVDKTLGEKFAKEFSKRYILIRNGVRTEMGRIVRIGRVQIIEGALVNAITFVKQYIDEPGRSVTENRYVRIPDDPEDDIEIFEEIDDAADLTDEIIDSDDDNDDVEFGGGKSKKRSYKKKSYKKKSKRKSKRKFREKNYQKPHALKSSLYTLRRLAIYDRIKLIIFNIRQMKSTQNNITSASALRMINQIRCKQFATAESQNKLIKTIKLNLKQEYSNNITNKASKTYKNIRRNTVNT
jgi:hypothetical protein